MTEQLDGTVPGEAVPGIATSSYAADDRLLAELRAVWPPAVEPRDSERGYVATDLDGSAPAAALRLGDRFAVALLAEPDGGFRVVPVVRDEILVTSWRLARPGDGLSAFVAGVPAASERAIDGDQTNVSVVVGERAIVKWSRTVGPGPSRATVLLAHLDAVGFRELPTPLGSLAWQTPAGHDLTIAQGDAFLPGARDGWEWCVERLERHVAHDEDPCPAGCDPWIDARLGELIGRLHLALATPSAVIPYPAAVADAGTVAGWVEAAHRTLDEALELDEALALEALALDAVAAGPDRRRFLAAIEPAMRAELDGIALDRPISVQPVHGDLHVGQVLEWSGGLAVIDFDGNPALGDRGNALRQPLERDIAQMLSSVDHVGRVVDRRTAGRNRRVIDEWIERTRRQFLAALEIVPDPRLLAAFEVEQECRELVYAARFLPRWRYAPLATLRARYGT